ncbi:hypothetical protein P9112_004543 [Eukaryota sp. TZLM1-RC]
MSSRFRCNTCYTNITDQSVLISCGHFLCNRCFNGVPGEDTTCPLCNISASTVSFGDGAKTLPQSVRDYFTNIPSMLERTMEVYKFGRMHDRLYVSHLEKTIGHLQSELQILKQSAPKADMENTIKVLKEENSRLTKELETSRSRSVPTLSLRRPNTPRTPANAVPRLSLRPDSRRGYSGTPSIKTPVISSKQFSTPINKRLSMTRKPTPGPPIQSPLSTPKTGTASRFNRLKNTPPPGQCQWTS